MPLADGNRAVPRPRVPAPGVLRRLYRIGIRPRVLEERSHVLASSSGRNKISRHARIVEQTSQFDASLPAARALSSALRTASLAVSTKRAR